MTEKTDLPKKRKGNAFLDPFGNLVFLKRALTGWLGIATYRYLNIINKTNVIGADFLMDLPDKNVLFVSNHQTYYVDVIALYHIFGSVKWKFKNINNPMYLLLPRVKAYYIAAEETMTQSGWLGRLFSYAGAVTVRRAWRSGGKDVIRSSDVKAPAKIKTALEYGWVVNFPQGTTRQGAPVRKGSASLIKKYKPIVVPVKLTGFDEAFAKKGVKVKNRGTQLTVEFGAPVQFGDETSVAEIQTYLENVIQGAANLE